MSPAAQAHSPLEVLRVFLKLGLSSFGGPIAHIDYFREEFVVRRHWLDDAAFSDLVALCQFLPGPASSQVGFSIGLTRAGYLGAVAAWAGFTLPSAIALLLFAYGATALGGPTALGLLHGLKLVAVAIVAQAIWGMARTLCPDRQRATIAGIAALIVLFSGSSGGQIAAIVVGAIAGLCLCRTPSPASTGARAVPLSRNAGIPSPLMFAFFLAGAQSAMRGINAAVVGILGGAFYDPVWTSTVKSTGDFGVALIGFVLLIAWRAPPLLVVVIGALAGAIGAAYR